MKGVRERLERGPKETQSPYDDVVLKDYKQQYAESHTRVLNEGQVYQCDVKECLKKFKTQEFVHKHIFNKHEDLLNHKFNQKRFE